MTDRGIEQDEDVAAVIAVITALAAGGVEPETPGQTSVWADPSFRLGVRSTGPLSWWTSGLPR